MNERRAGDDARRGPPEAPGSYPIVGHTPHLLRAPLVRLKRWGRTDEALLGLRLPRQQFYLVSDPVAVREILVTDDASYRKAEIVRDRLGPLQGGSLVLLEGQEWRERRQTLGRAMTGGPTERAGEITERRAQEMVDTWPTDRPVRVDDHARDLSLSILAAALFGLDSPATRAPIHDAAADVLARLDVRSLSAFLPEWIPTRTNRRYRQAIATLHDELDAVIDRQLADSSKTTLLSMLAAAGVPRETIRNELIAFLFAGYDSTATALSCTLGLLAAHPDSQSRVREELRSVPEDELDSTAVVDLPVLDAVVRESLRLYPPQYLLFREPERAVTLSGYRIEAGSPLVLPPWTLQRDPRFWDEPDRFEPDRWLQEDDERPGFAYFPYGGGPRHCLGRTLANRTLRLVTAVVCRRRSLSMTGSLSVTAGPTLAIEDGLDVLAEPIE